MANKKTLQINITIDCSSKNYKQVHDIAYAYAQNLKIVVEGGSKTTNCSLVIGQKKNGKSRSKRR